MKQWKKTGAWLCAIAILIGCVRYEGLFAAASEGLLGGASSGEFEEFVLEDEEETVSSGDTKNTGRENAEPDEDEGSDEDEASDEDEVSDGDELSAEESVSDSDAAAVLDKARKALTELAKEREIMALVYMADEISVYREPAAKGEAADTLSSGYLVELVDIRQDEHGLLWMGVNYYTEGERREGYVPRDNTVSSDERYLSWEKEYDIDSLKPPVIMLRSLRRSAVSPEIAQFPSSYWESLTQLKAEHPNWTFVKLNTNLDWSSAVNAQMGIKSLAYRSLPEDMKGAPYDNTWYYATEKAVSYYMDPRNWLRERNIFQFEQLTYNPAYHTEAAVEKMFQNTFMDSARGNAVGTGLTYARIVFANGAELGVSPYHLASRLIQEQGVNGTSPLISGNYEGAGGQYKGYYNFFNIKVYNQTAEAIEAGLAHARDRGWSDAYQSIRGGADTISANYIRKGQDTLYLQKFNVVGGYYALHTHQYMQNISAPASEAIKIRTAYQSADAIDNNFVFKIPVYNNMPAAEVEVPPEVAVTLPAGYDRTTIYLDGVAAEGILQNGQLVVAAPGTGYKTAVAYKYDANGIPTGMYVWKLTFDGGTYTAAPIPELEDLLTYHGFSIRITGKAGIRFKTGISSQTKAALTAGGLGGYTLSEYGTLVMNHANSGLYPMIKGGEKVLSGRSYGYNASGALEDKVYETKNGRERFTSVLVGLPANQYKIEYAFRGYAVLRNAEGEITLYGPAVAKSIYSLAEQMIQMGQYTAGSDADLFLRKLLSDAG